MGEKPKVVIHTDGACSGNPGPGGWGAILQSGQHRKELKGGEELTTNNRMELMAAISALEALKSPSDVDLYTDSNYLRGGITGDLGMGLQVVVVLDAGLDQPDAHFLLPQSCPMPSASWNSLRRPSPGCR